MHLVNVIDEVDINIKEIIYSDNPFTIKIGIVGEIFKTIKLLPNTQYTLSINSLHIKLDKRHVLTLLKTAKQTYFIQTNDKIYYIRNASELVLFKGSDNNYLIYLKGVSKND